MTKTTPINGRPRPQPWPGARRAFDRPKPTATWRTITPADARAILARNKRINRHMSQVKKNQFVAAMKEGRWNPHVSTAVGVDWDGNVTNGFTRLTACVEAGVPFETLFVENVDPAAFANEDNGLARTSGDFLTIAGEKYGPHLAAAARMIEMWDRGLWERAGTKGGHNFMAVVSNEQLLECVQRRPTLRKACAWAGSRYYLIRAVMPTRFAEALWVLTHGHPRHDAFWAEMVDGVGVAADGPVRSYRRRSEEMRQSGHRMKANLSLALVTKCWNLYAEGVAGGRLSYRPNMDRFPQPITRLKPMKLPEPEPAEAAAE